MTFEKYLKFNLKNKIIISLAALILAIFCLLYFIVVPTMADIKTMGEQIEKQREDLEKKYIRGQSLKKLTENLKNIEPKLNLLDQIFINRNRELEFITTLENKVADNQISQKINLNPPQTTENQEFQKAGLQLFTKGNFIRQLNYLTSLESLSYYLNIKTLEMSPAAAGLTETGNKGIGSEPSESASLNLFIDADTYWN